MMSWSLTAEMIESCNCNMLCPCWFAVKDLMVFDRDYCAGPLLFRIQQGSAEGVAIAGLSIVVAVVFPGPTLFDGNGTARLYISDAASAEQRSQLEPIFQGKKGGPMEIYASFISTWIPTTIAAIDIREEGDKLTAQVGEFGHVTSQLLKNEAGTPMMMSNVGFALALQFDNHAAQLAPSGSRWRDPAMPRQFETRSGARAICRWNVS
jgi:hypothetical protein